MDSSSASFFYHLLHIDQLRAMQLIAPKPEFVAAVERFKHYRASLVLPMRAFAHKVFFRMLIRRNGPRGRRAPFKGTRAQE